MSKENLRKHSRRVVIALACLVAAFFATAAVARTIATRFVAGNLIADITVSFSPSRLPRNEYAPLKFGARVMFSTKDGSIPPPLRRSVIEADKNSKIETRGLPVCTRRKLVATTTEQARRACGDAIVGTGSGRGVIALPEQAPIRTGSPVTIFNGPQMDGDPTVIAHAHLEIPAPTTYLVSARIERVHRGPIGYRVESNIPRIAGGYGSITEIRLRLQRRWSFHGRRLSYLNARCAVPGPHLLGRGRAVFADGTDIRGSLFASCQVVK